MELSEYVSSKFQFFKPKLIEAQINQETLEIIKFYQEISKNILKLIMDPNLNLGKLKSGLDFINDRIADQKFTITDLNGQIKIVSAPMIDLYRMLLDHDGNNLLKKAMDFAINGKWALIDHLKKEGLKTDSVDEKDISIDMIKKLHDSSEKAVNKLSGFKLGLEVGKKISEFVQISERVNLSLTARDETKEEKNQQPGTVAHWPCAAKIKSEETSREVS